MKPIWLIAAVGAALFFSTVEAQALEAGAGVVRGAQSLNLRSGAGTDAAPIGRLGTGDRVEIRSINGSWAMVRTPSGATGYVRVEYLANRPAAKEREDAPKPAEQAAPQIEPIKQAAPVNDATGSGVQQAALLDELSTLRGRNAKLESELTGIRAQLAAAPPQPVKPGGELDALRADVGRVLALAEEINKRVSGRKLDTVSSDPAERPLIDPNVWLFAGACIVFGVLLGGGYGRLQDRSRRTRIRL